MESYLSPLDQSSRWELCECIYLYSSNEFTQSSMILDPIQSHIHLLVNWFQLIFQVVNDAGREETAVAQSVLDAQAQDHLEGEGR